MAVYFFCWLCLREPRRQSDAALAPAKTRHPGAGTSQQNQGEKGETTSKFFISLGIQE